MAYSASRFLRTSTTGSSRPLTSTSPSYTSSYASSSASSYRTRHVSESSNSSTEATEDPYGQDDELVPVQYFKKLLECPVCLEYLKTPVHQCWEGHLLCKKCFKGKKLTQCPICRGSLFQNRNLAVEDVLSVLRNPVNRQKIQNEVAATATSEVPPAAAAPAFTKEDLVSVVSLCVKNEIESSLNAFKDSFNNRIDSLEKKVIESIDNLEDNEEDLEEIKKSCMEINKKLSDQNGEMVKGMGDMSLAICQKFDLQDDKLKFIKNDLDSLKTDFENNFVTETVFSKNMSQVEDNLRSLSGKVSLVLGMLADFKDGGGSFPTRKSSSQATISDQETVRGSVDLAKDDSGLCLSESNLATGGLAKVAPEIESKTGGESTPTDSKIVRSPSEPMKENQTKLPLRKTMSDVDTKPATRDDLHSILSQIVSKLSRAIESRESLDDKQPEANMAEPGNQSEEQQADTSESEVSETESDDSETVAEAGSMDDRVRRVVQLAMRNSTSESDGDYFDASPSTSGSAQYIPVVLPCPLHYQSSCSVPHDDPRSHLIGLIRFSPWIAEDGRWTYQSRIYSRHNVVIVENLGRWFQVAFNQIIDDSGVSAYMQVRLVASEPDQYYDFYVDISLFTPDRDGFCGSIQHEVKPYWTQPAANQLSGRDFLFHISEDDLEEYRSHDSQLNFQIEFLAVEKESD